MSVRDREALDLISSRSFEGAFVVLLDIEMLARRLTLALYGTLKSDSQTVLGTVTFFGAGRFQFDNAAGAFPERAATAALVLSYDELEDEGVAELRGRSDWTLRLRFEGLAYEEHPALLASLADDFD